MDGLGFSKEIRMAIDASDLTRVTDLLASNPDKINMITPFGTWLHIAARVGNIDIVKLLVEMGADVNIAAGTYEAGPLITAISSGRYEIVKYSTFAPAHSVQHIEITLTF
jgi:ankyrin repeat protein